MADIGPVSIGQTLKNRRLQKGLTLEFITAALRIQTRFLKALEEEQWGELPANVFLEGFLVKYAEYLGLDAVGLRTALRAQLGQTGEPGFIHPSPVSESMEGESMVPLRLFLFGLAVLAVVGGGFLYFRRHDSPGTLPSRPLNQVMEAEPIVNSTGTLSALPEAEDVTAPAPVSNNVLVLRAKETVWVRVRLDNSVRFEGTLVTGEVRNWPFTSTLRLRVGNVSRIAVTVNGKSMPESLIAAPGDLIWPTRVGTDPSFDIPLAETRLPSSSPSPRPVRSSTATVPANR
jgi:cytoskeleton protein RodZ